MRLLGFLARASAVVAGAALFGVLGSLASAAPRGAPAKEVAFPVDGFRLVERESGPVNYYRVLPRAVPPHIHAHYKPPYKTAVLGYQLSDADRALARRLRWRWRALTLPKGGNECTKGKGDSAAVIYVTWRRTLRWYTLKFVWSGETPKGSVCDRKRSPFIAQDTIVLRSGGPLNTWQSEDIDLRAEFRKAFADGDPNADVPDLLGIGLMTDGDQTQSESAADYADFVLVR